MRLSQLSPSRRKLVRMISRIGFGTIENLQLQDGEPVFDGSTKVVREIAFGKPTAVPTGKEDFELKAQVVAMCQEFNRIRDGTIPLLRIRDGLPCMMLYQEVVD
jgi:hypothetical protein